MSKKSTIKTIENDGTVVEANFGSAPKKKSTASLEKKKARQGWLFVLPFIIGFVAIYLPIIYDSIYYSLCSFKGNNATFVGLKTYADVIAGENGMDFLTSLGSGLATLIVDIPTIIVFSLFIAVLLNQKIIGRAAFRAIFFMPVILSTGLIASIDLSNAASSNMEQNIDNGVESSTTELVSAMDLQVLFSQMAVGKELVQTVADTVNNIYDVVNRAGVQMLIFLAGLQSISPAIYESCEVEGATAWETFWKITFPMISPMILVNLVYTVIDSFTDKSNPVMQVIEQAYDSGGNGRATSAAMAWMYFLVVILIIAALAGIVSAYTFYQRKDK